MRITKKQKTQVNNQPKPPYSNQKLAKPGIEKDPLEVINPFSVQLSHKKLHRPMYFWPQMLIPPISVALCWKKWAG